MRRVPQGGRERRAEQGNVAVYKSGGIQNVESQHACQSAIFDLVDLVRGLWTRQGQCRARRVLAQCSECVEIDEIDVMTSVGEVPSAASALPPCVALFIRVL